MGPRSDQAAFLIGQVRMFDLQRTLAGPRSPAENFQDQPGAIHDFRIPGFFQIALLHWGKRTVHHDDAGIETFDQAGNLFDLALAKIGGWPQRIEHDDAGLLDLEVNGARKADRFIELCRWRPRGAGHACPAQDRLNHEGTAGDRSLTTSATPALRGLRRLEWARVAAARLQSTLFPGRRFFGALEKLHWVARHDGRNSVLVDKLGMAVATQ
jgi:hypothetical protein